MARYIDAELLDPEEFENCTPYQAREIIESIPTADVVPKSEVEKIFAEIDELLSPYGTYIKTIGLEEYIELKKKYTEVNNEIS